MLLKTQTSKTFLISNDIEILNKLNKTDKLFKEWKIWFKLFNESFLNLKNKLNIK